jgi:hypothetical protein
MARSTQKHEVVVSFTVVVEEDALTAATKEASARVAPLHAALVADAQRLGRWVEIQARRAVGGLFAKDLHENDAASLSQAELDLLRPLARRLGPEDRAYFEPRLANRSWLQTTEAWALLNRFRTRVLREAPKPPRYIEASDEDFGTFDDVPFPPAGSGPKKASPKPTKKGKPAKKAKPSKKASRR